MMRYIISILLLSVYCLAQQQYGVMSVCTKVDGTEHCFLTPGEYRAVEMDGTTVVAAGFNIQKYTSIGKETVFTNSNGSSVRFWESRDEYGNRYLMHASRNNLFITDTTGCAMMKYVTGGPEMLRKLYRFEETDSIDAQMEFIVKCRENRAKGRN